MGLARFGPMLLAAALLAACATAPDQTAGRLGAVNAVTAPTGDQRMLVSLSGPSAPTAGVAMAVRVSAPRDARPRSAEATGTGAELAFVTSILHDLQLRSFAANAEHCGYVGLDQAGNLISSPINRGDEASCPLPQVPPGMTLLASFHTHGTYSRHYASEFPTTTDLMTDAADRIDGYISTPGGRLWYADSDTLTVRQLCGRGCLPQDPGYVAADDGPVRPSFTLNDLHALERN